MFNFSQETNYPRLSQDVTLIVETLLNQECAHRFRN